MYLSHLIIIILLRSRMQGIAVIQCLSANLQSSEDSYCYPYSSTLVIIFINIYCTLYALCANHRYYQLIFLSP